VSHLDCESRVLVAGARGMVGSALVRSLHAQGYMNVLAPPRAELDLLDQKAVLAYLQYKRPDYIFIAAAKVGGIHANNQYRADFIYENLIVEANVIHGAHLAGVQRLMFLGSSCIYPRECPQPIREDYLLTGPLEPTNEPYAIAKIAGIKLCENYNRQYGRQYVSVMPTNLYGPHDHYDLHNSHVLPALIRKFHLGKLAMAGNFDAIHADELAHGPIPTEVLSSLSLARREDDSIAPDGTGKAPRVEVWGSGSPRREFLYVDDLATACVHLMATQYDGPLVNLGCGEDNTIRTLAETVREVVGFKGELMFDASKPDGTPRKWLDVSRIHALGWKPAVELKRGIALAYADYCSRA
jgi:GDP-L-fucose synthase